MHKDKGLSSFVFFSGSGCLLPALVIFNLLFGWIFLKPKLWLITEATLILFFIINSFIITRKIISTSSKRDAEVSASHSGASKRNDIRDDVIDVKGEVVEDRHKRKEILDDR